MSYAFCDTRNSLVLLVPYSITLLFLVLLITVHFVSFLTARKCQSAIQAEVTKFENLFVVYLFLMFSLH